MTRAYHAVKLNEIENAIIAFTSSLYDQTAMDNISKEEIRDILSSGQLMSKKWLIEEFKNRIIPKIDRPASKGSFKIAVVGGWIGLLAYALMKTDGYIISADSIDFSEEATRVANQVLQNTFGSAVLQDMYELDYSKYNCIVNTSGEHIVNVEKWADLIPPGKYVVVQSNNSREIKDHISCVDSSIELEKKLNLSEVYFSDELVFPMYTRYMVIGRK